MSPPLDFATPHFKTLPDDEGIDRITMEVVPRYKQSGLSGDEWRISARVRLYRKGVLVHERDFGTMQAAVLGLGHLWLLRGDGELSEKPLFGADEFTCCQPGCGDETVKVVRLKQEFSAQGDGPLPKEVPWEVRRAFCSTHAVRGDCGREDADANYEVVP